MWNRAKSSKILAQARALERTGNYSQAIVLWEKLRTRQRIYDSASICHHLGNLCAKIGDYRRACQYWDAEPKPAASFRAGLADSRPQRSSFIGFLSDILFFLFWIFFLLLGAYFFRDQSKVEFVAAAPIPYPLSDPFDDPVFNRYPADYFPESRMRDTLRLLNWQTDPQKLIETAGELLRRHDLSDLEQYRLLLLLAEVYQLVKQYPQSLDTLNTALKLPIEEFMKCDAYALRAYAHDKLHQGEAAFRDIELAVQLDPNYIIFRWAYVLFLVEYHSDESAYQNQALSFWNDAKEMIRQEKPDYFYFLLHMVKDFASDHPNNPYLHFYLGLLFNEVKDYESAFKELGQFLLSEKSQDHYALYAMAYQLQKILAELM
jgi:tetratricopeptide (TPR) repeat protein